MLNSNRVISFVKSKLGFPFTEVEIEDQQILDFVTEFSLRDFSYYSPELKRINLNVNLESNRVSGRANEYYINDPEGLEILNVKEIYFNMGNYVMLGHPPMGPLSHIGLREWALQTEMANQLKSFSSFGDYTFEFQHPNVIRISPTPTNTQTSDITIEYERMQNSDFSGISNDLQLFFLNFCAADIMMKIGVIRKKYGDGIKTPFGDINLNSDIYEEGKELKREIVEKLSLGPMLNKIVDFG
jgi:hypothetical protein